MNNQDKPAYPCLKALSLTKLEAFTMAAMHGLCSNPDARRSDISHDAVILAKHTLAELEKSND